MSLMKWLNKVNSAAVAPGMPNPAEEKDAVAQATVSAANDAIGALLSVGLKKRDYSSYDDTTRAQIGKYATQHGTAATIRHFSSVHKRKIPESTIRDFKRR